VTEFITTYPLAAALLAMLGLGLAFGSLLGFASIRFKAEGNPIADQINAILPQTQCGQCGYPGCRPYAEAIASGEAINKCPPGGEAGIQALADLLDVEAPPLDAEHGEEAEKTIAFIIEEDCIGCTKCIQACPVDAIIGAAKQMHTVVTAECTGCDLCVEPCPVDCIEMRPVPRTLADWHWELPRPELTPLIIASDRVGASHHAEEDRREHAA
jgi:electron transport complex protein RnfB